MPATSAKNQSFNQPLFTVSQAAELLGVSSKTLRRWDEKGILPSLRTTGGQRRYVRRALEKFNAKKDLTKAFVREKPAFVAKPKPLQSLVKKTKEKEKEQFVKSIFKPSSAPVSSDDDQESLFSRSIIPFLLLLLFLLLPGLILSFTPLGMNFLGGAKSKLASIFPFLSVEEESESYLAETGEGDQVIQITEEIAAAEGSGINLANIFSHLWPGIDDTYDIGSVTREWKDLYVDGTAHIDDLVVDNNATITNDLTVTNNITVGGVNSDLLPTTDDTYDLGSADHEWQDLFVNGTALVGILRVEDDILMGDDNWIGLGGTIGRIEFDNQGSDEVNILNANVGIGTQTPTYRLDVSGDGHFSTDLTVDANLTVDTNTLYVDSTNNRVGIGTITPSDTLSVAGGVLIGSTYASIGNTAPANGMLIEGNVGLGTTLPDANLHLVGDMYIADDSGYTFNNPSASDDLYVQGNIEVDGNVYLSAVVAANMNPSTDNSFDLGTETLRWQGIHGAHDGIYLSDTGGTSGAGTDYVRGRLYFSDDGTSEQFKLATELQAGQTTGGNILIQSDLPTGQTTTEAIRIDSSNNLGVNDELFQIGDSGGDLFTILGGGSVGIGTTKPTDTLHDSGNILGTAGVHIGTDSTNTLIDDSSNGSGSTTLYIGNESILASGDIGASVQAWDTELDDIAALADTDGNFIVGNGTNWVAETGNTARTSLGLGTGDSPSFTGLTVSGLSTDGPVYSQLEY